MKAILKFDLPDEEDEYENANNGWKYLGILRELDTYLRNEEKYRDVDNIPVEDVRQKMTDLFDELGVPLW